ncbi:MAG: IS66 family insertion sequence element accessory protein TnpB [Moraxellaceae bacterium]|nr:IS66 family insertion sequence element accessory protein TnpB [Moraxellaceae bacterium]
MVAWAGNGVWLCLRRLHQGHFVGTSHQTPPPVGSAKPNGWLISGVDWSRLNRPLPAQYHVG